MQEDYETFGDDYSYYILYASTDDFLVREQEKVFMGLLKTRDPQFGYNTKDRTNDVTLKNFKRYSVPENWGIDGNKKLSEAEKKKLVLDESVVWQIQQIVFKPINRLRASILDRKMSTRMTWRDIGLQSGVSPNTLQYLILNVDPWEWKPEVRKAVCKTLGIKITQNTDEWEEYGYG